MSRLSRESSPLSMVIIPAGTFVEEVVIGRDLDVGGASSATTVVEGRMVVEGAAIQVDVHDLTIDASALSAAGCFADALLSRPHEVVQVIKPQAQTLMPSRPSVSAMISPWH
jgi:hypothetical protein